MVLTLCWRKWCSEETTAAGSQNISSEGYPRDAEISKNKPPSGRKEEEEVRAVRLRCLCINTTPGFPFRSGDNFYSGSAHLGTCRLTSRQGGRCSKPWG